MDSSQVADLEVPFSILFADWTFIYENHYKGLVKDSVLTFVEFLSQRLISHSMLGAQNEDRKGLKAAMLFVLKHADRFNISEFLHCLQPNHLLFGEILLILHKNKFDYLLSRATETKYEAEALSAQNKTELAQLQQIKRNHDNSIIQDKNKILLCQQELQTTSSESDSSKSSKPEPKSSPQTL